MARCANCNFDLRNHDERSLTPGYCDKCGHGVCFICGCSQDHPCERECAEGTILMCGWRDAGLCNFCYWLLMAEAYSVATGRSGVVFV